MKNSSNQHTIETNVSIHGKGLHTGVSTQITLKPADVNSGIQFRRIDLKDQPIIPASIDYVYDCSRGTNLMKDHAEVNSVEHLLAAISGLGIDNILIELDNKEIPVMGGSAKAFTEAILNAGIIAQNAPRDYFKVDEFIEYSDLNQDISIKVVPYSELSLEVIIDYPSNLLSNQEANLESLTNFNDEIAKCRTFVFLHELEKLHANNLIQGGDLKNAIVFIDRKISQEELDKFTELFNKPKVEVKPQGILNNLELYFENEPARHKLLDLIGDLSLLGMPIQGKILAHKPGHFSNIEFVKLLKHKLKRQIMNFTPPFDLNKEPFYDVKAIQKILPHRPPFLFVDKVLELNDTQIVGMKNVTMNENFFVGHFPGEPVLPGVIQIETMAQVGGILALSMVEDPETYTTYFLKIDKVKFRKKVVPGDTVVFSLELISPIRRGIVHMKGLAYVADTVVMEAEMMASLVKNK